MSLSHRLRLAAFGALSHLPGAAGEWATVRLLRRKRKARRAATLAAFDRVLAGLGEGSVCLDLGANVGTVTERMAATGAHVHAFEPDPWAHERLVARVGALPNVTLHRAAVGLEAGEVHLNRAEGFDADPATLSEGSTLMAGAGGGETVAVEQIDLRAFLRGLDRPVDLVKMDIEGAELALLEALLDAPERELLRDVFVETHEIQYPALRPRYAALRERVAAMETPRIDLDWP